MLNYFGNIKIVMENKINIAELLKDCPSGMELYSPLFGNCTFVKVHDNEDLIIVKLETGATVSFQNDGRYYDYPNAECILFPSKYKTTWEGFQCPFKDGDIISTTDGIWIGITTGGEKGKFIPTYCVIRSGDEFKAYPDRKGEWAFNRLATEEEKQKLFNAIKENGYRWNPETKTLEKLPKFKVGDKIKHKDSGIYCTLGEYSEGISAYRTNIGLSLTYKDMEQWELVPNKFDIDTLVPFESRVLVRNGDRDIWKPAIFGCYIYKSSPYYVLGGTCWKYCIPYEGNKHLLRTTNDCDKYYKN